MSRKLLIALGVALALTLAFSGAAAAGDAGTSGGMCQGIDLDDAGAADVGTSGTSGGSGDVGTLCCTTECGIF